MQKDKEEILDAIELVDNKCLSEEEKKALLSIIEQLAKTPIFETEKLVELLESTTALTEDNWREAMLDTVYAGDEDKLLELIEELKQY